MSGEKKHKNPKFQNEILEREADPTSQKNPNPKNQSEINFFEEAKREDSILTWTVATAEGEPFLS